MKEKKRERQTDRQIETSGEREKGRRARVGGHYHITLWESSTFICIVIGIHYVYIA